MFKGGMRQGSTGKKRISDRVDYIVSELGGFSDRDKYGACGVQVPDHHPGALAAPSGGDR